MGIGIIELLVLAFFVAVIVRAIGSGHAPYWLGAMAVIAVVVGLGIAIIYRIREAPRPAVAYPIDNHTEAWVNESLARGEKVPDMYGGYPGTRMTAPQAVAGRPSGVAVLLLVSIAAFAVFHGMRHSGHRGLLIGGAGASLLLLLGGVFVAGTRRVEVAATIVEPVAEVPMDDLYERITQPRIELEAKSEHDATHVALASAMEDAGHGDHQEASVESNETVDDPFGDESAKVVQTEAGSHEADDAFNPSTGGDAGPAAKEAASDEPPQPRPVWVGTAREYANKVWRVPVEAGPYLTKTECDRSLWAELREEVTRRIRELASEHMGRAVNIPNLETMGLGGTFIANELLADRTFYEEGTASFGATQTAWALLEFDENDDRRLLEAWQRYAHRDGIKITTALSALVLSMLGLVFGLIKVDTWTRGYYTKRLFLGVPAAIIVVIALLGMIAP